VDGQWVTVAQIAERLSIAEETVRRWLRSGDLCGVRLSDRAGWRVKESDVARYLAELASQQRAEIKPGRPRKSSEDAS
jgi:excisionase family DNA binding protein